MSAKRRPSRVEVTVLIDDEAPPGLQGSHGLACYVKVGEAEVLFDAGPSSAVVDNAARLGVKLSNVGVVVLSHGHYDHTGGLLDALRKAGRRVPIVVDPAAFEVKLAYKPWLTYIGVPFTLGQLAEAGGVPVLTTKPTPLGEGVTVTGRIERRLDEPSNKGLYVVRDGGLVADEVLDDRALVVQVGGRAVVLTGCAHAGVVNVVEEAYRLTKAGSIALLAGGFHLFNATSRKAAEVARRLERMNVEKVAPCHCTGQRGLTELRKVFEDRCTPLRSGSKVVVEAEPR